ncbi:BMC domain-containing protein [Myxococcota bacterium]|nr:BMC domain-containing protein [Myxococcota bacterium]MBU1431124.1 BMC domain-containing protein [Myxococcota bacterium]MBU1899559.1 BMC domain-containing protein [Myxococcota bacterium]
MDAPNGPALGLMELCSIPRGILSCDAALKRAPVRLHMGKSVEPGKYLYLLKGGVDEVYEALKAGRAAAGDALIDELLLPDPHRQITFLLESPIVRALDALGILETWSIAAALRGADAALKRAEISGLRLKLAQGLGGKAYFAFTGLLHDVEEAMRAGRAAAGEGMIAGAEIIANPHGDLARALS